ncbi:hypothetical protein ASG58_10045 [Rhizobium sp. Leaf383]|nr:hypothetical protein ASG58_10045 [Rhizobium sp. Leaf383]
MRGRSLWTPDNTADLSDLTVPIHLAYCQVVAALRHHAGAGSPNLAIVVVQAADAVDSFVSASRLYLRQVFDQHGYTEPFVRSLKNTTRDRLTELEIQRRAAEAGKSILVCSSLDDVDEELRLFADVIAVIPTPTSHQIIATFRRYGHAITSSDEEMIRSETWTRLVYAFQPNRPVKTALRRLRESVNRTQVEATPASTGPTLADLTGLGEAKEWGLELARDLDDFKAGLIPWSDVDVGALISGPPGTGKTLFAEALARTCGIPIVVSTAAQWQANGYLNDMLRAMRESFSEARSQGTALLFIDELDAVGSRAMNNSHNADYTRQVINALLELLDGFDRRSGIVVVGATNHPEYIDPAILRPGRLDKHFVIPLPDAATRRQIFQFHAGLPVPDDHEDGFAHSTTGMSGADLAQLVRNGRRTARRQGKPFEFGHVASIASPLVDLPAEHMLRAAYHEAGHAIVGLELKMELEGITINDKVLATGVDSLGGAAFRTPMFSSNTRSYYLDQICMYLAGLGSESLIFGEFTEMGGDPRSDLARATALATRIEGCYGMGGTLAIDLVDDRDLARLRAGDIGLRKAVTALLDTESKRAKTILDLRNDALNAVAKTLVATRVMNVTEVQNVLKAHPARIDALGSEADRPDDTVRVAWGALLSVHADDIRKEVGAALRRWGVI